MSAEMRGSKIQPGSVLAYRSAKEDAWVPFGVVLRTPTGVAKTLILVTRSGIQSFDKYVSRLQADAEIAVSDSTPQSRSLVDRLVRAKDVRSESPIETASLKEALDSPLQWGRTCKRHPGEPRPCVQCKAG